MRVLEYGIQNAMDEEMYYVASCMAGLNYPGGVVANYDQSPDVMPA